MSIWSGVIQGAGSVLGGLLGYAGQSSANKSNLKATRETNEANRLLNERQYEMAQEFWRMNNEYNLPSNQMQRLKTAGLNPNLVYGNGTVVGNSSTAPSVPSMIPNQSFTGYRNELAPLGDAISGMVSSISQVESMRALKDMYDSSTEKNAAEAALAGSKKTEQDIINLVRGQNAVADGKMSQAKLDNIIADTGKKESETALARDQANNEIIKSNLLVKEMDKLDADIAYTLGRKELLPLEEEKLRASISQLYASAENLNALSAKTSVDTELSENDLLYRDLKNFVDAYEKVYNLFYPSKSKFGLLFNDIMRYVNTATDRQVAVSDMIKEILIAKGYKIK